MFQYLLFTVHVGYVCMFDNRKYTQGYIEFQFLYLIITHSIDLILIKHRFINLQQWQQQKENTFE